MIDSTKSTRIATMALALAFTMPAMAWQRGQGKADNGKGGSKNQSTGVQRGNRHTGDWLRKNMNTPLAQQKQELENSEDFKKLPADRQQQLLQRLNRFNSMSPDQKNRVITHMVWLDHLTPDQKDKAKALHQQFHDLSVDRRQAIRRALYGMRDMNPDERQKNIESPQIKSNFSDHERDIMKGYTSLGFPDQHTDEDTNSPQEDM